ncbi:MAG TPA: universal stress protein [Stellaceae bacterium]|nr:universal stress protein [Stellaceae bacterium]
MAYKDLLVVLDTETQARERLRLAADLAERFNAHLVGLHITVGRETARLSGQSDANADHRMRALFDNIVRRRSISAEWRIGSGYPLDVTDVHARYADLIIMGQLDPENEWAPVIYPEPEYVALASGRPILVVPYIGTFPSLGQRVLVGWDASREAARAVNDAMPLLATASSVTVVTVDPTQSREEHGDIPGADIALHLARHGVKAAVERTASGGVDVGNVLLSRASDIGAHLLVMGAYAHSRVRELILGGATRTVLESMTLPVFMAH